MGVKHVTEKRRRTGKLKNEFKWEVLQSNPTQLERQWRKDIENGKGVLK